MAFRGKSSYSRIAIDDKAGRAAAPARNSLQDLYHIIIGLAYSSILPFSALVSKVVQFVQSRLDKYKRLLSWVDLWS